MHAGGRGGTIGQCCPVNSQAPYDEIPSWALFYRICTALPVNETGTFHGPLDRDLRYNR
jgi:hypothetical protein